MITFMFDVFISMCCVWSTNRPRAYTNITVDEKTYEIVFAPPPSPQGKWSFIEHRNF